MCKIADVAVFSLLIIGAVMDWKEKRISVKLLVLTSLVIGIFSLVCQNVEPVSRLFGAGVGIFAFFISRITKEAIGYGDDWLILLLGIYLGGGKILLLLLWASLLAGLVSLGFLCKKKWRKDITIPFVPFLAVAYAGVVFL